MPLMDEFNKRGSTTRGGGSVTPQMWRHEVRPREIGEFAVIRFISPFGNPKGGDTPKNILADESYYMYHAGQHASGKRFTNYVYCADLNQDSNGHIIEPSKCQCQLSVTMSLPAMWMENHLGTVMELPTDTTLR